MSRGHSTGVKDRKMGKCIWMLWEAGKWKGLNKLRQDKKAVRAQLPDAQVCTGRAWYSCLMHRCARGEPGAAACHTSVHGESLAQLLAAQVCMGRA